MAEPALKLSFKFQQDDFRSFFRQTNRSSHSVGYLIVSTLILLLFLAGFVFASGSILTGFSTDATMMYASLAVLSLAMIGIYLMIARWLRTRFQIRTLKGHNNLLRPISFEIATNGISTDDGLTKAWYDWKAFEGVEITDDAVLLFLDPVRAVIVPRRVLGDESKVKSFKANIDSMIAAAQRA